MLLPSNPSEEGRAVRPNEPLIGFMKAVSTSPVVEGMAMIVPSFCKKRLVSSGTLRPSLAASVITRSPRSARCAG